MFLEPWYVIYYLAVEVPKPLPNPKKQNDGAGTEFTKTNRANKWTSNVEYSDSRNVWSRVKQQAKQA